MKERGTLLSEILKKIVEESTNEGIRFIEHTTEVFVSYKELYNKLSPLSRTF